MPFEQDRFAPRPTNRNKPREPLYEFSEMADHLDVLPGQLRNAMRDAEVKPPEPRLIKGKRKWWSASEMIAWWVQIGGREFAVSKREDYNRQYALRAKSVLTCGQTITA